MKRILPWLAVSVLGCVLMVQAGTSVAEASAKQVDVYVTSWCPFCKKATDFLTSQKVAFRTHDIEKDKAAADAFDRLGGGGVPVLKIGDRIIRGFDKDKIVLALKEE